MRREYRVIVVGGGHAGLEAAWSAANLLGEPHGVALVTLDPGKIGAMSCNPAIGGLAKGQLVREIDAMHGLMGLATDATGIHFKMLNTSKGAAVHGPRAQCDKLAYSRATRALIAARPEIDVVHASVEGFVTQRDRIAGVEVLLRESGSTGRVLLSAPAVVLTTGTFMRGLMHQGEIRTQGGRAGEDAAVGISAALRDLGFELGRLKTGTPPRVRRSTIDWEALPIQPGDACPTPFSDLTPGWSLAGLDTTQFPRLPQLDCRTSRTTAEIHDLIRANLHRAPMFSGQIESIGPRYCPSIEDKVVRFGQREGHGVFLEPESHESDWVYLNGIATSLPVDVQDGIVRRMPGLERAEIVQHGYAVEYDMVRPHQIRATGMTKRIDGLFLAGQINGTSGYEEAAAQGLVAGINAARYSRDESEFTLGRDRAYIGVLMDDLVTKTPVEPYRMFTSRAEHRLLLRADNAPDRLTPIAEELGLLDASPLGSMRRERFARRRAELAELNREIDAARLDGEPLARAMRRPEFDLASMEAAIVTRGASLAAMRTALADRQYESYLVRQRAEIRRLNDMEHRRIPGDLSDDSIATMRTEARQALRRFTPETFGQASRLEGMTPADLTLLAVIVERHRRAMAG
ncbi:MAG: tRNA uridine-5-carboxymethylaminomethyl(34) synthesis enzyme MnmG [Phycisphaeraceae bacterium]|nr:tRNA uridine-5-carboxymethylaminomethyl(34) synthesis enzyme MnmG [Phycisphaeraceae bacterium]